MQDKNIFYCKIINLRIKMDLNLFVGFFFGYLFSDIDFMKFLYKQMIM